MIWGTEQQTQFVNLQTRNILRQKTDSMFVQAKRPHANSILTIKRRGSCGLVFCTRTRIPLGRGSDNSGMPTRDLLHICWSCLSGVSNNTADTIHYSSAVTGGDATPQINTAATWHYLYLIYLSTSTTTTTTKRLQV